MSAASYRGRGSSQRARIRELGPHNPQPNFNQPRRDVNLPPAEFWLENLPSPTWPPPPQPQQFPNFESHRYLRVRPQFCPPGLGARGRSKRIRGEGRARPGILPVPNFGGIGGSEPLRFPPLGSEEERQQKIAETADKLKLKLSSLNNVEEPVNFWEDDLSGVNFSQENEELAIVNRGIPELRHDPPELNLTVNDFKDIGRVDPDNSINSGDSVEILSPEINKSKTIVAEENSVDPKTKIENYKNVADNANDNLKDIKSPRSNETAGGSESEQVKAAIERLNYALAHERKTSTPNPVEAEVGKEINSKCKPDLTKSLEKLREVIKVDRELEKEEKSRSQLNTGPRLQPDVRMDFHPGIGAQYPRFPSFNHTLGAHEIRNRPPPQFRSDHPPEICNNFATDFQLLRPRNFNIPPRVLDQRIIHPEFNPPVPQRMINRNSDLQVAFDPREPPPRFNAPFHDERHRNKTWYNHNEFRPPPGLNGIQQASFNPRPPPQRFVNPEQDLSNFLPAQEFPQILTMGYPHVPHIVQHRSRFFNPAMPPPNTAPCIIPKFPPPSVPRPSSTVENNRTLLPPPMPRQPLDVRRPPSPPKLSKGVIDSNPTPNMNDELEDMQEALEFAKKLMNMTEEDVDAPQSFNMPVFPNLPPIPLTESSQLTDGIKRTNSPDLSSGEKEKEVVINPEVIATESQTIEDVVKIANSKDLLLEEKQHDDNKNKSRITPEENTKAQASTSKTNKSTSSLAIESVWKEKVINRFLKMSKNDICNMVNSSGKRKNDIVMKQLVREQKYSLSQERRCSADDAVKGAYDISQEEEFISQLKAVLDPSATVDIKNLPAEFIQQLSEVLKLDVESHLNESADLELLNNDDNNLVEARSFKEISTTHTPETNVKTEIKTESLEETNRSVSAVDNAKNSSQIGDGFHHHPNTVVETIPRRERSEENEAKTNSHGFVKAKFTSDLTSENNDNLDDKTTKPRIIDGGEVWARNNKRHNHDIFRNLSKEDSEAKNSRNRSGTPSIRSPRNLKSHEMNKNLSSAPSSRESTHDVGAIVATQNAVAKSDNNSLSDSSSISSDSDDMTTSNVTKLLKVIKEREKIAKELTLGETIRDEVTAEMERAKQKDKEMETIRRNRYDQTDRRRRERKRKETARTQKKYKNETLRKNNVAQERFVKKPPVPDTHSNLPPEVKNSLPSIQKHETTSETLIQEANELLTNLQNSNIAETFPTEIDKPKDVALVVAESRRGKCEAIESVQTLGNAPIKKIDIGAYKARKHQYDVQKDDKWKESGLSIIDSLKQEVEKKMIKESSPTRNEKKKEKKVPYVKTKNDRKEKNEEIKEGDGKSSREKETRNHFRDSKRSSSRDDSRRSSKEKYRNSSREKRRDDKPRSVSVDKSETKVEYRNNNVVGSREKKAMSEKSDRPDSRNRKHLADNKELTRKENRRKESPEHFSKKKEQLRSTKEDKKNPENRQATKIANEILEPTTTDTNLGEINSDDCTLTSLREKNNSVVIKSERIEEHSSLQAETTEQKSTEAANPESEVFSEAQEIDSKKSSGVEETLTTSESTEMKTESLSYVSEVSSDFNDIETVLNELIDKAIIQLELLSNKNEAKENIVITENNKVCNEGGKTLVDDSLTELDFPGTPEDPLKGFSEETIKSSILGKRKLDKSVLEITEDYILNKKSKDFDDIMPDMIAETSEDRNDGESRIQDDNLLEVKSETIEVKVETEESLNFDKVSNQEIKDENITKCATPSGDTLSLGSTIDFDHNEFIVLSEISSDENFSQDEDRKSTSISDCKNMKAMKKIRNKQKVRRNSEERTQKSNVKTQKIKKDVKNLSKPIDPANKISPINEGEKILEDAETSSKPIENETSNVDLMSKKTPVIDNDVDKRKNSESKRISKEEESKIEKKLHRADHKHKTKHKKEKKLKLDEKQIKEIMAGEELVTVVKKQQTKEDVMARMVAIDLEIHKLMSEKMKLYQMLESGKLPSEQNITQGRNDSDENLPETLKVNSRSSSTNENCRSIGKQKISVSKPQPDPSIIKSAKIIASCIAEDLNQKDGASRKARKSQNEHRKLALDSSISRRKIDDKSASKRSNRSESRCSSSSRRREEEAKEKKEKSDHHHISTKKKQNKIIDSKEDIVMRRIKKETQTISVNDETESFNPSTEKQIYCDESSQLSLSQESKIFKKNSNRGLFDEIAKPATSKKRRVVNSKMKNEKSRPCHKGANSLSASEEEMPLNLLLVKKSRKKRDVNKNSEANNSKIRYNTSTELIVDHVSETINAVAENKTGEHQRRKRMKQEFGAFDNEGTSFHRKSKVGCKIKPDLDVERILSNTQSSATVDWSFQHIGEGDKNVSDHEFGDLLLDDFDNGDTDFPIDKIIEISRENNGSDIMHSELRTGETESLSLFSNFYAGDNNEKLSYRQWSSGDTIRSDPPKSNTFNYRDDVPRFDDSNSNFVTQEQTSESHSISKNFKDIEKGLDVLDSMLETVDFEGISNKDAKKGKRKRNSMSKLQMMNCSVKLVDCKYTYLKDTVISRPDQQYRIFNVISLRENNDDSEITEDIFSSQRTEGDEDWMLDKRELVNEGDENLLSIHNVRYLNDESDLGLDIVEENSVFDDNVLQITKQEDENKTESHNDTPNHNENIIQSYSVSGAEDWKSFNEFQSSSSTTEVRETEGSTELGPPAKPPTGLGVGNVLEESEITVIDDLKERIAESEENCAAENENVQQDTVGVEAVDLPRIQYSVHKGPILDVKVFGDSILAASEDGVVYRYSQTCNGILNTYEGHNSAVTCIHVFQNSTTQGNSSKDLMFSGSLDGSLRCFDITTSHQVKGAAEVGSPVQCMDQSWGVIFLGTKSGYVFRFNIKSHAFKGDEIKFSDESVLALKATTEGPRRVLIVASRSQPITIRDAQSGLFLRTVSGHKTHTVYSLLMDSNLVYCGTSSTAIPVFDFINGSQAKLYNAGPGIVCMRMYKWLLFAGCYDGNIYVFDTKEERLICSIPGPGNMLLSMDVVKNKIVAGSKDRRLHMWQMPEQVLTVLAERT